MFNIRLYNYPNGAQIRIYSDIQNLPMEEKEKKKHYSLAFNPFTEQYGFVEVLPAVSEVDEEFKKNESVRISLTRTVNTIYHLSRSNNWDWFITLTFNPDLVDSFDYSECTRCLSKWLNNVRRSCPDMRYLVVPERHQSGRYHFHGLFADCDALGFTDSGKKTSDGQTIYNVGKYRLGFTTATRINDNARVTKYICKYINKDLIIDSPG